MFYTQHEKDLVNRKIRLLESDIQDETIKNQQHVKDLYKLISSLQQHISEIQNQLLDQQHTNDHLLEKIDSNYDMLDKRIDERDVEISDLDSRITDIKEEYIDDCNNSFFSVSEDITELNNKLNPLFENVDILMTEYKKAVNLSLKYTEHVHRFDQGKPRAEITSSYVDKDGKLNTEIHWNDEFVQNLIKQGFTGGSDQEVVQLWLANLLHQFRENEKG